MKEIDRVRKKLRQAIRELHEVGRKVTKYLVTKSLDELGEPRGWTIAETRQMKKDFDAERKALEKCRRLMDRYSELVRKAKDCEEDNRRKVKV